jgi:hypothetical protein
MIHGARALLSGGQVDKPEVVGMSGWEYSLNQNLLFPLAIGSFLCFSEKLTKEDFFMCFSQ